MRFHAVFIGGALSLAALGAGCGDDGGGVVSNSHWRLWSPSTATFSDHDIIGANGDNRNEVECFYDGTSLEFRLRDAGLREDTGTASADRFPSEIEFFSYLGPGTCRVSVTEAAKPDRSFEPKYEDSCAGGCTFTHTADEATGILTVNLSCTNMVPSAGGETMVLASSTSTGGRAVPASFQLENCF